MQICNMLKKKHEEAKEILVRAIVNNNNLLMVNHPVYEEKISFQLSLLLYAILPLLTLLWCRTIACSFTSKTFVQFRNLLPESCLRSFKCDLLKNSCQTMVNSTLPPSPPYIYRTFMYLCMRYMSFCTMFS